MSKKNNVLVLVINIILATVGIGILYFASLFWMGSKADYEELVNKSYWSFFASRLFFNFIIELMILGVIGFINWIVQKITKAKVEIGKILIIEFLIFTICSIVFIAFRLS